MSSCEVHCTLKNLSDAQYYYFKECKLRTISGLLGNGTKFIGPPCEVLAEDLESIRIRLKLTDQELVEAISNPETFTENNYNLRLGYWEFYNNK